MVDHNVDEVTMVRRLSDGTPDHPGGFERIVSDDEAVEADKAQLDAIESNARDRAAQKAEAAEVAPVEADDTVELKPRVKRPVKGDG